MATTAIAPRRNHCRDEFLTGSQVAPWTTTPVPRYGESLRHQPKPMRPSSYRVVPVTKPAISLITMGSWTVI